MTQPLRPPDHRMRSSMHRIVPAIAVLLASACAPSAHGRLGTVVGYRQLAIDTSTTLGTWSAGESVVATPDQGTVRTNGDASPFQRMDAATRIFSPVLNAQASIRFGISDSCEVGGILGQPRLAAEYRCRLTDERKEDDWSTAWSGAFGYQPGRGGPWLRAGVDASAFHGSWAPFANLYLTFSPESHSQRIALGDLFGPTDPERPPAVRAFRDELRITAPLGAAYFPRQLIGVRDGQAIRGRGNVGWALAFVPHWTAWAGEPDRLTCVSCPEGLRAASFSESWGFAFTVSLLVHPSEIP